MKKILSCAFAFLLLAGCAGQPAAQTSATPVPTPTAAPTATLAPAESFGKPNWDSAEYGFTKTDEQTDETIMTAHYVVPRISNEPAAPQWKVINEYYTVQGETLEQSGWEIADMAQEDYDYFQDSGYEFHTYADEQSYELKLDTDALASILHTHYAYTGGAHGNVWYMADTFNMETGARLTLDDLFTVPESEYRQRLMTEIERQVSEQWADMIDESALDSTFDPSCFYLTDDALVIYYQTYSLGPYALGAPEFPISRETLKDILISW